MTSAPRDPALLLGDVNAEADDLLSTAFYASPDYKTLLEHSRGRVVVGRRGTGKSALAWKLGQTWQSDAKMVVIKITPTEDAVIGLRSLSSKLGDFARTRAFFRIAWKVAMGRESLWPLVANYKYKSHATHAKAQAIANEWHDNGSNIVERLCGLVRQQLAQAVDPDATIGQLQKALDWSVLESTLSVALDESKLQVALVIDRADEGYKPDDLGLAIVAGLVHAAIEMSNQFSQVAPIVFLRDNIARAMAAKDSDYARVIESRAIRLHWGDRELFDMASERIRISLGLDVESSKAVWNRFVLDDLKDIDGFRKCLRHTLYRPRDVLVLLNKAYYNAHKKGADRIDYSDIEATAKTISSNRLNDLLREYEAVAPGLEPLVRGLGGKAAQFSRDALIAHLESVIQDDRFDARTQQGLQIIDSPAGAIRLLYEFGVIGVMDSTSGSFAFCHDGHELVQDLTQAGRFLVHPCYWMALDIHGGESPGDREEIYDEYEITAIARTPQQRVTNINRLVGKFTDIAVGPDGASDFEQWCHKALCTLFAGQIRNLQLKPNAQAPNRRDIVGRNGGEGGVWRQLVDDYGVRQVVFEVKNYADLTPDDLRQIADYLHDQYGRCGFIICRQDSTEVRAGGILDRIRDIWANHRKLVVILNGKFIVRMLNKIRSPAKCDAASQDLERVVDDYEWLYVHGQQAAQNRQARRGRKVPPNKA